MIEEDCDYEEMHHKKQAHEANRKRGSKDANTE